LDHNEPKLWHRGHKYSSKAKPHDLPFPLSQKHHPFNYRVAFPILLYIQECVESQSEF
jgi:hypothetical protein